MLAVEDDIIPRPARVDFPTIGAGVLGGRLGLQPRPARLARVPVPPLPAPVGVLGRLLQPVVGRLLEGQIDGLELGRPLHSRQDLVGLLTRDQERRVLQLAQRHRQTQLHGLVHVGHALGSDIEFRRQMRKWRQSALALHPCREIGGQLAGLARGNGDAVLRQCGREALGGIGELDGHRHRVIKDVGDCNAGLDLHQAAIDHRLGLLDRLDAHGVTDEAEVVYENRAALPALELYADVEPLALLVGRVAPVPHGLVELDLGRLPLARRQFLDLPGRLHPVGEGEVDDLHAEPVARVAVDAEVEEQPVPVGHLDAAPLEAQHAAGGAVPLRGKVA